MKCPCVCINFLLEHFRMTDSEETFQYLPSRVRTELNANPQFCQKLFHPVFNRENGQRIITERRINNQEHLVRFPTTQQELASRLVDKLVQPRKTSNITSKGTRYQGHGEASGGNTTSPDRARRRRDGEYFSSTLTQDVSPQNFMLNSAVDVLLFQKNHCRVLP